MGEGEVSHSSSSPTPHRRAFLGVVLLPTKGVALSCQSHHPWGCQLWVLMLHAGEFPLQLVVLKTPPQCRCRVGGGVSRGFGAAETRSGGRPVVACCPQNFLNAATASGLSCSPMEGIDEAAVKQVGGSSLAGPCERGTLLWGGDTFKKSNRAIYLCLQLHA